MRNGWQGLGMLGALIVVTALSGQVQAEILNRIVATIDGEPVTQVELEDFEAQIRQRPGAATPEMLGDPRAVLDQLILERVMKKQIEAQGLSANEKQIDGYIESIRERNNLSEEALKAALTERGMSWEAYREQVRTDIERANLINKEIRNRVNVTPEEIQRYYEAHLDDYATPPKARVRLLSLLAGREVSSTRRAAIRAEAERLRALIADGKSFAKLAKEHSEGPGAEDGGDIGEVSRDALQDEFAAVFDLDDGEVTPVIETDTGFHVLQVSEKAMDVHRQLDEVEDEIREKLYGEAIEERYDRWLKRDLRARHSIEILL